MGSDWALISFCDSVLINPTVRLKKGFEYPFVDMKSILTGSRDVNVTQIKPFNGGGSRFLPKDTLMARITPCLENGKIARYMPDREDGPAFGSTEFIVIRGKDGVTDNLFAYYLTSWLELREFAISQMTGSSGRQRVPVDSLAGFKFRLPPLPEQRAIAHILGSLDDKIELNRQMNETLEAMAQALFKSWFNDFDPVIDNILLKNRNQNQPSPLSPLPEGEGNVEGNLMGWEDERIFKGIPEELRERAQTRRAILAQNQNDECSVTNDESLTKKHNPLPEEIRKLFPNEFEFTKQMGWIPKGWRFSMIGEEVDSVGGATPSTKNADFWDDGDIYWTTPKDLSDLNSRILLETDRKITEVGLNKISSGLLSVDTVLMSSRAPVGYLALAKIPVAINQGYIAMKCTKQLTPEFVIQWAGSVMDDIKQRAGGTTFAEISKKNFRGIPVIVPDNGALENYSGTVKGFYDKITENLKETEHLTKLRDRLLPGLISGKIRISKAEKMVENLL